MKIRQNKKPANHCIYWAGGHFSTHLSAKVRIYCKLYVLILIMSSDKEFVSSHFWTKIIFCPYAKGVR